MLANLVCFVLILLCTSHSLFAKQGILSKKKEDFKEHEVPVRDFKKIKIKGIFDIDIIEDNKYEVKLRGSSHALHDVEVQQQGETLNIFSKVPQSQSNKKIKLIVTSKKLNSFKARGIILSHIQGFSGYKLEAKISGLSELRARDLTYNNLNLTIEGKSKLYGHSMNVKYINAKVGGSSETVLSGKAESVYLLTNGQSLSDLKSMESDLVKVSAIGNSKIRLESPMVISLKVSGVLDIAYKCLKNKKPELQKEVYGSLKESCL